MSEPFIGEIRLFGGNFAPQGWSFCNGSLLAISQNDALFNLIGTTYGGDGVNTFGLPDLRGRVPVQQGNGFVIGQSGGTETETLTTSQMPPHTHALHAFNGLGNEAAPGGNVPAASVARQYSSGLPQAAMLPSAVLPVGGSQPHDNMLPFLAISFILSLFGIFPSQT